MSWGWRDSVMMSRAGNTVNEDAVCVTEHGLVVVDGATGLARAWLTGWPSDAQWFSHRLADLLGARVGHLETTIPRILKECLQLLQVELAQKVSIGGLSPDALPSASVMIARINGTELEVYSLGDCQALIGHRGGGVRVCHDAAVSALDSAAIESMCAYAAHHKIPIREARAHVGDQLLRNRRLMNTPDGYWIAELSGAGTLHGRLQTFAMEDVVDVAVMTDGFAAALDPVRMFANPTGMLNALRDAPPTSVVETLFGLLTADPEYAAYPRLKHIDDASVIYAALHN